MSLLVGHGFEESQTASDYCTVSGTLTLDTSVFRTGSQSLKLQSGSPIATFSPPAAQAHDTFIVHVAIYRLTGISPEIRLSGDSGATRHITMTIRDADGSADVRRGTNSGTQLGSSIAAGTFPINTWVHVVLKVKLHDSTGTVDVYVNGASVLSLTGQDTKNAGTNATLDTVAIASGSGANIDDLIILNGDATAPNSILGDKKVIASMPNADGTTVDFTLSTGSSHYQVLDETPRTTTDYGYTTTNGHIELVSVADVPAGTQNISAVVIELYANKSDAGAVQSFQRACRSGGTNYFGNSIALGTTATYLVDSGAKLVLATDPATAAAWTVSNLNAAEWGVKAII